MESYPSNFSYRFSRNVADEEGEEAEDELGIDFDECIHGDYILSDLYHCVNYLLIFYNAYVTNYRSHPKKLQ